jgi:hypothetical protein
VLVDASIAHLVHVLDESCGHAGQDVLGEDLGVTHAVGAIAYDPLDGLGLSLAGTQDGDDIGECLVQREWRWLCR